MKITIFTGGTGSIALQRGLYHSLEEGRDGIDIKIVVNAYDNGLSTGAVRRVMSGRILGPSDVRKNQTTRLQLQLPNSPWLKFLGLRFTANPQQAQERCKREVEALLGQLESSRPVSNIAPILSCAIDEFFKRPDATQIEYDDFSLANIVYAGLSSANGNSLRAAAQIMAKALDIQDNVVLNDDTSLFLGAITRSGKRISDEAEIVTWGNKTDPFVDLFFVDTWGNYASPELCLEAWHAIVEADLIILSSGTQWSSLIPTYASRGYKAAIRDSNAKILMVMNRAPDKDGAGLTASDIVSAIVPRYFDEGRLHVLADTNGHPSMRHLDSSALSTVASFTESDLSTSTDPPDKHNPAKLANAIGNVFFREYVDSTFFLFDYDDTLCGRDYRYPKSSSSNIRGLRKLNELTNIGICTGNTIRALHLTGDHVEVGGIKGPTDKPILVFADGGANEYAFDMRSSDDRPKPFPDIVRCVCPDMLLPTSGPHRACKIIERLIRAGIPASNIDNRGNAVISIRPVNRELRRSVMSLARNVVFGSDLVVREAGTSTVEIRRPKLSKVHALKLIRSERNLPTITYVGDECESGNDHDIEKFGREFTGVRCLHVNSPAKTAFFIWTLIAHLQKNAKR